VLYYSTGGDNSNSQECAADSAYFDGWLTASHHCDWTGISCSCDNNCVGDVRDGKVRSITRARSTCLTGTIPSALGSIQTLIYLTLNLNPGLTGTLPSELGQLQMLINLTLNNCGLEGSLPKELGMLHELQNVSLNGNRFNGTIPVEVGELPKLAYFDLKNNAFTGTLPAEICNVTSYRYIISDDHLCNGLPPACCDACYLNGTTFPCPV